MFRKHNHPDATKAEKQSMEQERSQGESITTPPHASAEQPKHEHTLPTHLSYLRFEKTKGVKHEGESGRKGVHPWHFLRICFRSSCTLSKVVNVLWPVVPIAIAVVSITKHHLIARNLLTPLPSALCSP